MDDVAIGDAGGYKIMKLYKGLHLRLLVCGVSESLGLLGA
jgi:hypothetical protein